MGGPSDASLLVIVWTLLALADSLVTRRIFPELLWSSTPRFPALPFTDVGVLLLVIYQVFVAFSIVSHVLASSTDPGYVHRLAAPRFSSNLATCALCDRWKPPRAHHCVSCKRCVFRMDHHCAWINNCIGASNQKYFVLFLLYVVLTASMTLVLTIAGLYHCLARSASVSAATSAVVAAASAVSEPSSLLQCFGHLLGSAPLPVENAASRDHLWVAPGGLAPTDKVFAAFTAFLCVWSILFAGRYLVEQFEGIFSNATVVESHYGTFGEPRPWFEQFKSVFGEFWWMWPLPVAAAVKVNYDEPVFRSTAPDGSRSTYEEVTCRLRLPAEDLQHLGISEKEGPYTGSTGREPTGRRGEGTARRRNDTPPPRCH